jgi:protein phosphatase 1 regulatory subunit 42
MADQRKGRREINQQLILSSTALTKSSKESVDAYLKRVTHLHMQNKRLCRISGLDDCKNIKVLYLYDNQIEVIENLDFAAQLQYLYLQNNQIRDIPSLLMPNLTKLYLEENEITFVSGLEQCTKIQELYLARQRLPMYSQLQFDYASLQAISRTLQILDISGNGITQMVPFTCLFNLRRLYCEKNAIADIAEIEAIIALDFLEEATFLGNPCALEMGSKYRDYTIGASSDALIMLDNLPVLRHQQIAMRGLSSHRKKLGLY